MYQRVKENPSKTGNLETDLKLKIGAPVVITSNHSKQKFREDGIMNGARGYVTAVQVSKENAEKVEIVWALKHPIICCFALTVHLLNCCSSLKRKRYCVY